MKLCYLFLSMIFLALAGCKKEPETVLFVNNNIPAYDQIPTIIVENYVNRIFIDLIGREPTDSEMTAEVSALESAVLSVESRTALADKLMNSTAYVEGDSTYQTAYHQKYYNDNKARFLEGMSESEVIEQYNLYYGFSVTDSILGNMLSFELTRAEANKIKAVMTSKIELRNGVITVDEMCERMCFNAMYDNLHMNTFNFINATFDDLFYRYPTEAELDEAYEPIEQVPSADDPDLTGYLFGETFSTKQQYLRVLTGSEEYAESMIRWAFLGLLSREPSTAEVYNLMNVFGSTKNIEAVQKWIITGDEYAGFDND